MGPKRGMAKSEGNSVEANGRGKRTGGNGGGQRTRNGRPKVFQLRRVWAYGPKLYNGEAVG